MCMLACERGGNRERAREKVCMCDGVCKPEYYEWERSAQEYERFIFCANISLELLCQLKKELSFRLINCWRDSLGLWIERGWIGMDEYELHQHVHSLNI